MNIDLDQLAKDTKEQISEAHYRVTNGMMSSRPLTLEELQARGKDTSDDDVLWGYKYAEEEFHRKFAEAIIKDCSKTIIKAYHGHINPDVIIQAIKEQYDIDITKTKVCSNKVDDVCQLHNLHCTYPRCEE